jgi:hypothetical protein
MLYEDKLQTYIEFLYEAQFVNQPLHMLFFFFLGATALGGLWPP